MVRVGSALFNANHGQLADEVRRVESAGIDFLHFDVFDGHFVPDLGFPPRTLRTLRPLTKLPFEVHLAANDPLRFLPALAESGANLVFLPAESTPLLYEAIFAVRERGLRVGLCLALGTPLAVLETVLPLVDAVLLLGRVTGEGQRGRAFNDLLLPRVRAVRQLIDAGGHDVDLQAAGGLETDSCVAAVKAGAMSLPLGGALHRESDPAAYLGYLRSRLAKVSRQTAIEQAPAEGPQGAAPTAAASVEARADAGRMSDVVRAGDDSAPRRPNFRVLVASRSFGPNCPEAIEKLRGAGCELIPNDLARSLTEAELRERIADVDVLVSGTEPVTASVLSAARRLKVIAKHGVGYENVDLKAARERGIPVAVAGGAISDSVADLAMALLLALARRVPHGDRAVRSGKWPRIVGVELSGKTLGIVGLGQIGKAVCRRAKGFGMIVVAHDAHRDEQFARSWGVRYVEMADLLSTADFITLHAPVTPETRNMIDAEALARVKPGAYLINTARGELVDEESLAVALAEGRLAGAASDVFTREPPGESPLLGFDNFIASPHSAGQTEDGLRKMGEITADNILRVLAGQPPLYPV